MTSRFAKTELMLCRMSITALFTSRAVSGSSRKSNAVASPVVSNVVSSSREGEALFSFFFGTLSRTYPELTQARPKGGGEGRSTSPEAVFGKVSGSQNGGHTLKSVCTAPDSASRMNSLVVLNTCPS